MTTNIGDVHVIHMRDPDSSCHLEVWVNGVQVGFEQWSFDPGAGYEMDEFEEMKAGSVAEAPDWLKARIEEAYDDMKPAFDRWSL